MSKGSTIDLVDDGEGCLRMCDEENCCAGCAE